jgi:amphiphysin
MSWKGFSKAISRLPQQLATATGMTHETKDLEFDDLHQKFTQAEQRLKSLTQDAVALQDQMTMSVAMLNSLHSLNTQMDTAVIEFPSLTRLQDVVIKPLTSATLVFDATKKIIVKRHHKLLDHDRHKDSVQKLTNKTDKDLKEERKLVQMQNEFDDAAREYNNINNQLKQEIPQLLALVQKLIDPVLQTLFGCMYEYHSLMHSYYSRQKQVYGNDDTKLLHEKITDLYTQLSSLPSVPGKRTSVPATSPQGSTSSMNRTSSTLPPPSYESSNAFQQYHQSGVPTPIIPQRALYIALYDYDSQEPGDLNFKKDDKIELIEKTDGESGWWRGKIQDRVGMFPSNYVAPL